MPTNPIEFGSPFDAEFLFRIVCVLSIGVVLAIIGFIILGAIAFYRNKNGEAAAFTELFLQGEVLKLLSVTGISIAVVMLAFAKIVEGAAAASILSGIAGYVLGGLGSRRAEKRPEDKKHTDKGASS